MIFYDLFIANKISVFWGGAASFARSILPNMNATFSQFMGCNVYKPTSYLLIVAFLVLVHLMASRWKPVGSILPSVQPWIVSCLPFVPLHFLHNHLQPPKPHAWWAGGLTPPPGLPMSPGTIIDVVTYIVPMSDESHLPKSQGDLGPSRLSPFTVQIPMQPLPMSVPHLKCLVTMSVHLNKRGDTNIFVI